MRSVGAAASAPLGVVGQYVRLRQEEFETSINPYGGSSRKKTPRQQICKRCVGCESPILSSRCGNGWHSARRARRNLVKRLRQLEERRGTEGRVDPAERSQPRPCRCAGSSSLRRRRRNGGVAGGDRAEDWRAWAGELLSLARGAARAAARILGETRECTAHRSPWA